MKKSVMEPTENLNSLHLSRQQIFNSILNIENQVNEGNNEGKEFPNEETCFSLQTGLSNSTQGTKKSMVEPEKQFDQHVYYTPKIQEFRYRKFSSGVGQQIKPRIVGISSFNMHEPIREASVPSISRLKLLPIDDNEKELTKIEENFQGRQVIPRTSDSISTTTRKTRKISVFRPSGADMLSAIGFDILKAQGAFSTLQQLKPVNELMKKKAFSFAKADYLVKNQVRTKRRSEFEYNTKIHQNLSDKSQKTDPGPLNRIISISNDGLNMNKLLLSKSPSRSPTIFTNESKENFITIRISQPEIEFHSANEPLPLTKILITPPNESNKTEQSELENSDDCSNTNKNVECENFINNQTEELGKTDSNRPSKESISLNLAKIPITNRLAERNSLQRKRCKVALFAFGFATIGLILMMFEIEISIASLNEIQANKRNMSGNERLTQTPNLVTIL